MNPILTIFLYICFVIALLSNVIVVIGAIRYEQHKNIMRNIRLKKELNKIKNNSKYPSWMLWVPDWLQQNDEINEPIVLWLDNNGLRVDDCKWINLNDTVMRKEYNRYIIFHVDKCRYDENCFDIIPSFE